MMVASVWDKLTGECSIVNNIIINGKIQFAIGDMRLAILWLRADSDSQNEKED